MIKFFYIFSVTFLIGFSISSCDNLDSVDLTKRGTFVKFFGGPGQFVAGDARQTADGGFICLGTIHEIGENNDSTQIVLFKLDQSGNTIWTQQFSNINGSGKSIQLIDGGYLIIGDSINRVDQLETKSKMMLLKTNLEGGVIDILTQGDPTIVEDEKDKLDFHGDALAVTSDGTIITLTSKEEENDTEIALITAYSVSNFDSLWQQPYSFENRSYVNGKSIFEADNGNIIWSNSSTLISDDNFDAFLGLTVAAPNSEINNFAPYGDLLPNNHYLGNDMCKNSNGFAIVGTRTNLDGESGEILFLKANASGVIQEPVKDVFDVTESESEQGLSITNTRDGAFIVLASVTSGINFGNGGQDFYLMKINEFGDTIWEHNLGGSDDEIDGVVRQTTDGGYFIFGTSELQGVSSMVLIKTNSIGELTD